MHGAKAVFETHDETPRARLSGRFVADCLNLFRQIRTPPVRLRFLPAVLRAALVPNDRVLDRPRLVEHEEEVADAAEHR